MAPNLPPTLSPLQLPRGDLVWYNTGRPNIRVLTGEIRARGYLVWHLHMDIAGFQRQDIPRAEWLHAVLINRVLLLIAEDPAEIAPTLSWMFRHYMSEEM